MRFSNNQKINIGEPGKPKYVFPVAIERPEEGDGYDQVQEFTLHYSEAGVDKVHTVKMDD
jgi:hypothetical protein